MNNNNQAGFTLIELVVVIVILGILAATAAPKFINIQSDATKSTLSAVKGSMESASSMVYSKSIIDGTQDTVSSSVVVYKRAGAASDVSVNTEYGYPSFAKLDWEALLDLGLDDFIMVDDAELPAVGSNLRVYPQKSVNRDLGTSGYADCYVNYKPATSSSLKPAITIVDGGC